MSREARSPLPGAVEYVGARTVPGSAVPLQEWRYLTTGRRIEVVEANAFAPAEALHEGATGYVEYRQGVPVVVPRPGGRLGRRPVPTRPGVAGTARRPPLHPRGGGWRGRVRRLGAALRRVPTVWWLVVLLLVTVWIAWGR